MTTNTERFLKYGALFALTLQTTSAVILTRWSKLRQTSNDSTVVSLPYISTTLVVVQELTKFILSCLLVLVVDLAPADSWHSDVTALETYKEWGATLYKENFEDLAETFKLAVPAALYTLQNNLVYVGLANLESTTFQVAYQSKVITTAVLSVLMLGRKLSAVKWTALGALMLGIILTQVTRGVEKASKNDDFLVGILSVVTSSFSSAFAGVYFEKILKKTPRSVWVRNAQLAFFSTILAVIGMLLSDGWYAVTHFFQGYDALVWTVIMVQALGGLIVAMVIKYADNIAKGFATALSIVICGFVSIRLFEFSPTDMFILGSLVVIVATMMYSVSQ